MGQGAGDAGQLGMIDDVLGRIWSQGLVQRDRVECLRAECEICTGQSVKIRGLPVIIPGQELKRAVKGSQTYRQSAIPACSGPKYRLHTCLCCS